MNISNNFLYNCNTVKINKTDTNKCRLEYDIEENILSNPYYQNNKNFFIQLLNLCLQNRRGYMSYLRHSKKYLLNWMDSILPKHLISSKHKICTKLYYIFYGIQNYPECKRCGSPIFKECKNVFDQPTLDFCSYECQTKFFWPKISKTKISNSGDLWNYKKCKSTWHEKYGCNNPTQDYSVQVKQRSKYKFNEQNFDSKCELAFYIYLKNYKFNFLFQPKKYFEYIFNNKKYRYFPDFKIDDVFYELKGDHFFKDKDISKEMICPFRHKEWSEDRYLLECQKYEAKHQCMIQNNVVILTSKDYQKYIDYVNEKYGKDFLKNCKNFLNKTIIESK